MPWKSALNQSNQSKRNNSWIHQSTAQNCNGVGTQKSRMKPSVASLLFVLVSLLHCGWILFLLTLLLRLLKHMAFTHKSHNACLLMPWFMKWNAVPPTFPTLLQRHSESFLIFWGCRLFTALNEVSPNLSYHPISTFKSTQNAERVSSTYIYIYMYIYIFIYLSKTNQDHIYQIHILFLLTLLQRLLKVWYLPI